MPLLLDAFVKGDPHASPSGRQPGELGDHEPFAPWTWATENHELAKAVAGTLEMCGVIDDLCRVAVCSHDDNEALGAVWRTFYQLLSHTMIDRDGQPTPVEPGDASRCHGCRFNGDNFSEALKKCSGCGMVWYHSRVCQQRHWKQHKPTCLANRSAKPGLSDASASAAAASSSDPRRQNDIAAQVAYDSQELMRALLDDPVPRISREYIG